MRTQTTTHRHGSSLLEAVVAAGVLAGVLIGLLPLTTAAWSASNDARLDLLSAFLARQRLQQLQTLTHLREASGTLRDLSTRLVGDGFDSGGAGLTPTGLGTLDTSLPGSSDWLDAQGRPLTWSATAPPGARYERRWAIVDGGGPCAAIWVTVAPVPRPPHAKVAEVAAQQCPWGVEEP